MTTFYIISLKANLKRCVLSNILNLLIVVASLILRGSVLHNVGADTSNALFPEFNLFIAV